MVTVSGSGFPAGSSVSVFLDSAQNVLGQFPIDSKGAFTTVITIYVYTGNHMVCAQSTVVACARFSVSPAVVSVTVDPASGSNGDLVTIEGRGFPPGELVELYLDTPDYLLSTPGPFADEIGGFSGAVRMVTHQPGAHEVCGDTGPPLNGSQTYKVKACAQFNVIADYVPSPWPSPSASPTLMVTPAAAHVAGLQPPIWPFAGAAALVVASGVGIFVWRRRRTRLAPDRQD